MIQPATTPPAPTQNQPAPNNTKTVTVANQLLAELMKMTDDPKIDQLIKQLPDGESKAMFQAQRVIMKEQGTKLDEMIDKLPDSDLKKALLNERQKLFNLEHDLPIRTREYQMNSNAMEPLKPAGQHITDLAIGTGLRDNRDLDLIKAKGAEPVLAKLLDVAELSAASNKSEQANRQMYRSEIVVGYKAFHEAQGGKMDDNDATYLRLSKIRADATAVAEDAEKEKSNIFSQKLDAAGITDKELRAALTTAYPYKHGHAEIKLTREEKIQDQLGKAANAVIHAVPPNIKVNAIVPIVEAQFQAFANDFKAAQTKLDDAITAFKTDMNEQKEPNPQTAKSTKDAQMQLLTIQAELQDYNKHALPEKQGMQAPATPSQAPVPGQQPAVPKR